MSPNICLLSPVCTLGNDGAGHWPLNLVRAEEEVLALREEVERGGDSGALAAEHTRLIYDCLCA